MTSLCSGANVHGQHEGRQHALLLGSGCTVVQTERKRKLWAGRRTGNRASRGLRASRLPVTCRARACGAWPRGHSLHPGEGAGAAPGPAGACGAHPAPTVRMRVVSWGTSPCGRSCPSVQVAKRAPESDARMGRLELEGCSWLFTDVPSSSDPPPPCLSFTLPQPGSAVCSEDPLLLPAPLSPAMPLSDEITSAQGSLRASVSWKGWKISQKQGPPAAPGLHARAPSPHFLGKENQTGGGSREGRANEVSLVCLPNCTARERKGTELKMDC